MKRRTLLVARKRLLSSWLDGSSLLWILHRLFRRLFFIFLLRTLDFLFSNLGLIWVRVMGLAFDISAVSLGIMDVSD